MPDEGYILPPGSEYEPGDVFADIPFPSFRGQFRRYRRSTKPQEKNRPEIFVSEIGPDKPDDLMHCTFQRRNVMVLSHGCELDKVLKLGKPADRTPWLCAPVEPFKDESDQGTNAKTKARQRRVREGTQWNRFYLPVNDFLTGGEFAVDLRRIAPLPAKYFQEATKICSLSEDARYELYSQMGASISGLVLYVDTISCPVCEEQIDPKTFLVASPDPEEDDDD